MHNEPRYSVSNSNGKIIQYDSTIVAEYAIDSIVTRLTPHCFAYPPFVDAFDVASMAFEGLITK